MSYASMNMSVIALPLFGTVRALLLTLFHLFVSAPISDEGATLTRGLQFLSSPPPLLPTIRVVISEMPHTLCRIKSLCTKPPRESKCNSKAEPNTRCCLRGVGHPSCNAPTALGKKHVHKAPAVLWVSR